MQKETADNVNNVPGVLKAFVILGGMALLAGVIMLAVMIVMRAGGGGLQETRPDAAGPIDLAVPAGVRVGQVVADGRRLVLLGEGPDGVQYVVVVDAQSGMRETLIRLSPEE